MSGVFASIRSKLSVSEPQDPDFGRRVLWGGLAGGLAYFGLSLVSPELGIGWFVFLRALGAIPAAMLGVCLVVLARGKRMRPVVRFTTGSLGMAVAAFAIRGFATLTDDSIAAFERGFLLEMLADVARKTGRHAVLWRLEMLRWLVPTVSGAIAAVGAAGFLAAVRGNASILRRVLVYATVFVVLVGVCLFLPMIVLLRVIWPPSLESALSDFLPIVELLLWGIAVDAGQSFGGSKIAERWPGRCLATSVFALTVLALVFWKPIAVEYHRTCWYFASIQKDYPVARSHLLAAYTLNPQHRSVAWQYAGELDVLTKMFHGDLEAARRLGEEAIRISPNDPDNYLVLGIVLERAKKPEWLVPFRRAVEVSRSEAYREFVRESKRWDYPLMFWNSEHYVEKLIAALGREGSPESVEELRALWRETDEPGLRRHIDEALMTLEDASIEESEDL